MLNKWRVPTPAVLRARLRLQGLVGLLFFCGMLVVIAQYRSLRAVSSLRKTGGQSLVHVSALAVPDIEADSNQKRKKEPEAIEKGSKGIILCLHDGIIPLGASLVRELRCLGNHEPIEIYHCSELSADNIAMLRRIDSNLDVIDVCENLIARKVMDEKLAYSFRSYWIKPLAIHQTSLEQVILMDADVVTLRDPAVLREVPGYKENGTVFFYDRVVESTNWFNRGYTPSGAKEEVRYLPYWLQHFDYKRFNVSYGPSQHLLESFAYLQKTCHEMDSSIVAIDKSRAGKALAVLWFLITDHRFVIDFSLGDKESFWLAYEFAHVPYSFSPWGASVVSSTPNNDLEKYKDGTLCGSLCHYLPVNDTQPELLYVNGKAMVDPIPFDLDEVEEMHKNLLFNVLPTHMTPRQPRAAKKPSTDKKYYLECLNGMGAVPVPPALYPVLWRRRVHYLAIAMNMLEPLASCEVGAIPTNF